MRRFHFSALNLALGYILLSILVLGAFATPLWYTWRQNFEERRVYLLHEESRTYAETLEKSGLDALQLAIATRLRSAQSNDNVIALADASGAIVAGNLSTWPAQLPGAAGTYTVSVSGSGGERTVLAVHSLLPGGYRLLVGRESTRFKSLESLFWFGLASAATVVLLLGIAGGILIHRMLLAQVHTISHTATAIVKGDLSRRLPIRGTADELDMLAQTVNQMLEQIEHLVHGVRNVSNAIAHDLRTPLAELRSRLEELVVTRRPIEETYAEVENAVADVDRVIALFNALLRLADIDTGARRSGFVEVDVAKVAREVGDFYQPAAELKGLTLCCQAERRLAVRGDPLLLSQAIANLIDNAIKYSEHGTIRVAADHDRSGGVEILVCDEGPGISDVDKPKAVERFYRGDASRGTPGVGLGLSLVAAVARLHGGILKLSDNHPGLRAALVLTQS